MGGVIKKGNIWVPLSELGSSEKAQVEKYLIKGMFGFNTLGCNNKHSARTE